MRRKLRRKPQTSDKDSTNGGQAPEWSMDVSTMARLSADVCARMRKQTTVSENDLDAIRAAINGYVRDPAGEQRLRDYISSETFDQRAVLVGATATMLYIAQWGSDPRNVGRTIGSDRPVSAIPPRVSMSLVSLVCDMVDLTDSDVRDTQAMVGRYIRGNNISVAPIVRAESLDARSVAAGAMLILTFFENVCTVAPVLPILQTIVKVTDWLDTPTVIPDEAAHAEALKDSVGVLRFTLFVIDATDEQKAEAVLRYNALRKQCELPLDAAMVELDDPEICKPILMSNLINLIRHIDGITTLIAGVLESKTAEQQESE